MTDGFKPRVIVEGADTATPRIVVLQNRTDEQRKHAMDTLHEILSSADRGEVLDLMVLSFRPDGGITMHMTPAKQGDIARLAGALGIMQHLIYNSVQVKPHGDS